MLNISVNFVYYPLDKLCPINSGLAEHIKTILFGFHGFFHFIDSLKKKLSMRLVYTFAIHYNLYNKTRCTRGVRVVFSVTRMQSSNSARINKFDFRTEKIV